MVYITICYKDLVIIATRVLVECMGRQSTCLGTFSVYDVVWTGAAMFS